MRCIRSVQCRAQSLTQLHSMDNSEMPVSLTVCVLLVGRNLCDIGNCKLRTYIIILGLAAFSLCKYGPFLYSVIGSETLIFHIYFLGT